MNVNMSLLLQLLLLFVIASGNTSKINAELHRPLGTECKCVSPYVQQPGVMADDSVNLTLKT